MSSPEAYTAPPRPTSLEVSPISENRDIMVSSPEPRGLKRKDSQTPASSEAQIHPTKKLKASDSGPDDDDDHATDSTRESTIGSGRSVSPVDDETYTPDSPEMHKALDRTTAVERAKSRRVEERARKKQSKEEEERARRAIEEFEQDRMEANFAQTMSEHERIRRQGEMSLNDLMQHQTTQVQTSPPREPGYFDVVGLERPQKQLHHFATKKSRSAMHADEVLRQEQATFAAGAVQRHKNDNVAEAGAEQTNGDAALAGHEQSSSSFAEAGEELSNGDAAVAGRKHSDGDSAAITSEKTKRSVTFSEEVSVFTFSSGNGSVVSSDAEDSASEDEDDHEHEVESTDHSAGDYNRGNAQNVGLKDAQGNEERNDSLELHTTPAFKSGPAGDPHVVRAEVMGADKTLSGTGLTDRIEQADHSRHTTSMKTPKPSEHGVVSTDLDLNNTALLDSKFGTVDANYPQDPSPNARLLHVTLEDQFDKLESIILNSLSHGDLTEIFASNFLLSLTMRFYSDWIDLSRAWHFSGNARSVEAVRLDMDLVKWIYRVLWHATNANTVWDASGVLRVRRDKAWGRRERRDSIDSDATEPESGDYGVVTNALLGESVTQEAGTQRNGDGEERREVEWALRMSWLEWAREDGLFRGYSEGDVHVQRTLWMLLVAEYSVVVEYGVHHLYNKDGNDTSDDNNDDNNTGRNSKGDSHVIGDNDNSHVDDGSTDTENEDAIELVVTGANYRQQRSSNRHPSRNTPAILQRGSRDHTGPVNGMNASTAIMERLVGYALDRARECSKHVDTIPIPPPTTTPPTTPSRTQQASTTSRPSLIIRFNIDPVKLAFVVGGLRSRSSGNGTLSMQLRGNKRNPASLTGEPGTANRQLREYEGRTRGAREGDVVVGGKGTVLAWVGGSPPASTASPSDGDTATSRPRASKRKRGTGDVDGVAGGNKRRQWISDGEVEAGDTGVLSGSSVSLHPPKPDVQVCAVSCPGAGVGAGTGTGTGVGAGTGTGTGVGTVVFRYNIFCPEGFIIESSDPWALGLEM
ncbi:hypothetical protein EG327_008565 [Venturia inaequalis]|uniref:Uncharacterized protein n=1 Tax=Venturia inaequalis TaxID=5025 RepID=A0A8H3VQ98_VENIN|nr:hypothetical protein EG327_008565 [Venturia inaequalis]